jgi:hypothetical protein
MRDQECKVTVHNVPEHAEKYIVARVNEGSLWYWGCWDDEKEAEECASTIGGIVVKGW